jgi:chemotaxis methyl-accepting protein methylase
MLGCKDGTGVQVGGTDPSAEPWPPGELERLTEVLLCANGPDVTTFTSSHLVATLGRRVTATRSPSRAAYLDTLERDAPEAQALRDALDVHHSVFFREPLAFAMVEQALRARLAEAEGGTEFRVWSAGCAGGHEAYSLAILLAEATEAQPRPMPFRVIATDRAQNQLEQARRGTYPETALHNVRLGQLDRWFTRQDGAYQVVPELRQHVDFSTHDLLDAHHRSPPAGIFGEYDMVACCNVLMYYAPQAQKHILDNLWCALSPGGILLTGEVERALVQRGGAFLETTVTAPVFRKGE